jgi:Ulp1 family protease
MSRKVDNYITSSQDHKATPDSKNTQPDAALASSKHPTIRYMRPSDLTLLAREGHCLNDTCMNSVLEMLNDMLDRCQAVAMNTYFASNLHRNGYIPGSRPDFQAMKAAGGVFKGSLKRIFIPVHEPLMKNGEGFRPGAGHWTLVVIKIPEKVVEYYDSYSPVGDFHKCKEVSVL